MKDRKPPFDNLYWNVAQLYAWAFLRDADLVNEIGEWEESNHIKVCCMQTFKKAGWNLPKADREVLRHLKSGALKCKGLENNIGDHVEIQQVQWQRLSFFTEQDKTYASFGRMPKIGSTKWYDLLFPVEDILKIWVKKKNVYAPKNVEAHKRYYQEYHNGQVQKFLAGEVKKPWQSQLMEEDLIRKEMGVGFNRKNFRATRKSILARIPHHSKTRLAKKDFDDVKAFLEAEK